MKLKGFNFGAQPWKMENSGVGSKLLKKMGWKEGKGLGKAENGIKECIKTRPKNNTKGFGYTEKMYSSEHHSNFDALLLSLNEKHSTENVVSSEKETDKAKAPLNFEKRSKSLKKRLHYRKFIQMKDVSRYSEEDINGIFGVKLNNLNVSEDEDKNTYQPIKELAIKNEDCITLENSSPVYRHKKKKQKKAGETLHVVVDSIELTPEKMKTSVHEDISAECDIYSHKRKKRKTMDGETLHVGVDSIELSPEKMKTSVDEDISAECDIYSHKRKKRKTMDGNSSKRKKYDPEINLKSCIKIKSEENHLKPEKRVSFYETIEICPIEPRTSVKLIKAEELTDNSISREPFEQSELINETGALPIDLGNIPKDNIKNVKENHSGEALLLDIVGSTESLKLEMPHSATEKTLNKNLALDLCMLKRFSTKKQSIIPPTRLSNFNTWLQTNRDFLKSETMNKKRTLNKLKKLKCMRSSNLSSIKGYGNWGI